MRLKIVFVELVEVFGVLNFIILNLIDIVILAKGIGNGVPLAAVVTTPEIAQAFLKNCTSIHLLEILFLVQQVKQF